MTTHKTASIAYWSSTILFSMLLAWSAVQYLTEAPKMIAAMTHLGYPMYFIKGLGVAKLLGLAALIFGPGRLKEWAYAGFTFNLIGAAVSHLSSGDGIARAAIPLAFLAVLAVSYFMERKRHLAGESGSYHAPSLGHAH